MDAIYARQSIDKKDSISIETQIELCRLAGGADKHYSIYTDKGYSGKNMQRPAFQRLLAAVREGQISKIIIYRLDRLSRSLLDFARLVELFDCYQVTFVSTQEHFDTSTPMGNAMLNIAMVFAQLERETITCRVRDNYYSRAKRGLFLGGPAPYGLINTTINAEGSKIKILKTDIEQAKIVCSLYEMYAKQKLSLSEIARALNQKQVLPPQAKLWDSSKISRILRNPVYVKADASIYEYYLRKGCEITNPISDFVTDNACLIYGKRADHQRKFSDVSGHCLSLAMHQGIIAPDLFLTTQKLLDNNLRFAPTSAQKNTWLFSLIHCGNCGATLKVNCSNQGRYRYFVCQNRAKDGCDGKFYLSSVQQIEAEVEKLLLNQLQKLSHLELPAKQELSREHKELQAELISIKEQREQILDLALNGGELSRKYLEDRLRALQQQEQAIGNMISSSQQKHSGQRDNPLSRIEQIWPTISVVQKQALAAQMITDITLGEQGLTLTWKHRLK